MFGRSRRRGARKASDGRRAAQADWHRTRATYLLGTLC